MKKIILGLLAISLLLVGVVATQGTETAMAQRDAICEGIGATGGDEAACKDSNNTDAEGRINDVVAVVINVFSWVVGVLSVIFIIFGGFKYVTSGGDSSKVSSAKNTILYAIIGLIIVALAQVIVIFVLDAVA